VKADTQKRRRVDFFSPFVASVFAPHLFSVQNQVGMGCGACTLALITGIAPETISAENGKDHYSDRFMRRFLTARNYRLLRLTPDLLSRAKSPIGSDHVILICQLYRRNEATWGVVHAGAYYHNFSIYLLSTLSFLNKPIVSAYLVCHPKWRVKTAPELARPNVTNNSKRMALKTIRQRSQFSTIRTWA